MPCAGTWMNVESVILSEVGQTQKEKYHSQFSSVAQSCLTLCDPMDCSTPGLPVHHQLLELLKFMSIESVMPSNHLILCRPLLLLSSIFPRIRVFSNESQLFVSGGQSIGASASVLPMNIQDWVPLGLTGLISLLSSEFILAVKGFIFDSQQFHIWEFMWRKWFRLFAKI